MGKYEDYTTTAKDAGSDTPNVDALAKIASEAFDKHVQSMHLASMQGLNIREDYSLSGMDVEMRVSPTAYNAMINRFGIIET